METGVVPEKSIAKLRNNLEKMKSCAREIVEVNNN